MIYDALFAGLVWVKNACIGQNTPHEALLITNGWFRNMKSESQICRSAGDIFLIVDVLVSIMRGGWSWSAGDYDYVTPSESPQLGRYIYVEL